MANDPTITRRGFTKSAAIAAASVTALVSDGAFGGQNPALTSAGQAEVDASVSTIIRKYGNRLTDPQKLDIRRIMTDNQKSLEAMRSFPLTNADQPANVLKIYPDGPISAAAHHSNADQK